MSQISIEKIQEEMNKVTRESRNIVNEDSMLGLTFSSMKLNFFQTYWMNDRYMYMSDSDERETLFEQNTECVYNEDYWNGSKVSQALLDELKKCLSIISLSLKSKEESYIKSNMNLNTMLKEKEKKLQDQENKLPNIINSINIYEKFVQGLITQEIEEKIRLFLRKIQRTFNNQDISSNPFLVYLSLPSYLKNEKVQTKKFMELRQENKIEFDNKEDLEKFVKFFSDILSFNLVILAKGIEDNYNKQMVELAEKIHKEFLSLNLKIDIDEISFPKIEVKKSFEELIANLINNIEKNQTMGGIALTSIATTSIFGISFGSNEVSSKVCYHMSASELKKNVEIELESYKRNLLTEMTAIYNSKIRKQAISQKINYYTIKFQEYKKQETTKIKNIYNKEVKEIEETIASSKILQKRNKKLIQRVQVAQKLLSDMGDRNV